MVNNKTGLLLTAFFIIVSGFSSLFAWPKIKQVIKDPRLVIILVDETDSFGQYSKRGKAKVLYWDEALALSKKVVNALDPGDEFLLISINEKGFEEEDILIPLQQLDLSFLKAKIQKRKLCHQILSLKRKKATYRSTDILGALYQAAHFAKMEKGFKPILICFSDMVQEPRMPTMAQSKDLAFPSGTKGYFFFVDTSGKKQWDLIIKSWLPILNHAQLDAGDQNKPNFFQYGESKLWLNRIISSWNK